MGLRLLIFDRTDRRWGVPRLSAAWRAGASLYRGLGWVDAWRPVSRWSEALDWLVGHGDEPIDEIQFWGHGNWGCVKIDGVRLDAAALKPGSPHHARLCAIRERMSPGALWWFRTCETFGAEVGHDFARRWTDFFGRRAAGHTYVIGSWQSGLHSLEPGDRPAWPADEGIAAGSAAEPAKAKGSRPWAPNTISFFRSSIPEGY
jgi:hypothetical protein